jgi:hypothetical protein
MNDLAFQRPGPMPFRLLLDEALRQARRHFRAIYPQVAIPLAVFSTLIAVFQALWFSRLQSDQGAVVSSTAMTYLLALVAFGLLIIAFMAMLAGVMDALTGRAVDMKRAWRFALQGRVLGTLFFWFAAGIVALVCCCVPALFLVPMIAFVPVVMLDEARFGLGSFSRSAELTLYDPERQILKRPLLKVLLLLVVVLIVSSLLGLLVALPFQLPMYVDMFRRIAAGEDPMQGAAGWIWLQVPAQFLNALVSTAVYLYLAFGLGLFFLDTRGRKEGTDLRSEIDAVFGGPPPELPL